MPYKKKWESCLPKLTDINTELYNHVTKLLIAEEAPSNQLILKAGEVCTHLICVEQGTVEVTTQSKHGRELALYQISNNSFCLLNMLCLICDSSLPAHAYTSTNSKLLLLEASVFKKLIKESDIFKNFIYTQIQNQLATVLAKFEQAFNPNIGEQLAALLIIESEHGAKPIRKTQKDLSREIGTAREVISRNMAFFKENGWVRYSRGVIHVENPDVLAELSAS